MPTAKPAQPSAVLIAHDRWATNQLLIACQPLTHERLHQPFAMGAGSLHNNLAHIVGALRRWTDTLDQKELRPRIDEQTHSVPELQRLHDEASPQFERAVLAEPFDAVRTPTRDGVTYRFTVAEIFTHVMTHSVHHRAQCLNMLRQLGVEPLPTSSVLEWSLTI